MHGLNYCPAMCDFNMSQCMNVQEKISIRRGLECLNNHAYFIINIIQINGQMRLDIQTFHFLYTLKRVVDINHPDLLT